MAKLCSHDCPGNICNHCWYCQKELDEDDIITGTGYCHAHKEFTQLGHGYNCDDFDCFNNHKGEAKLWGKEAPNGR